MTDDTLRAALAEALHQYFREPSTKPLDVAGMEAAAAAAILATPAMQHYEQAIRDDERKRLLARCKDPDDVWVPMVDGDEGWPEGRQITLRRLLAEPDR